MREPRPYPPPKRAAWKRRVRHVGELQVGDESEMAGLEAKAQALGIPTYIVHDAGRTQIAAGSQTVLAIGPAPKSQLDTVTGHLKLL
ncbi:Peptidyl-tRNA hydrolase 2 [Tetrabaena socialis]|uniref:peptidyl-tRNA hydrolase n=1 Tax=Tetrabaena socialis TaxID=47790 RepID=A0A2J8A981_9CHLO|nr:Peptidyl-tRNA hydrolase 2 [Tetrabaena socialis]|eukprot:PNH09092.1 Peptidyl-tRNA hydrolase 2 [Tetrabaena socialis]